MSSSNTFSLPTVIQNAVFVFNGHFEIPLAAALAHSQKAENLLAAGHALDALIEAQQAVDLAPDDVKSNTVLGNVLTALNRPSDARKSYERALYSARTVHPEFQPVWVVRSLERMLAH